MIEIDNPFATFLNARTIPFNPQTYQMFQVQLKEPCIELDVKLDKGAYLFNIIGYSDEQERNIRKWCRSQGRSRVRCRKDDFGIMGIMFKPEDSALAALFKLTFKE